jgi:hypothetical protein
MRPVVPARRAAKPAPPTATLLGARGAATCAPRGRRPPRARGTHLRATRPPRARPPCARATTRASPTRANTNTRRLPLCAPPPRARRARFRGLATTASSASSRSP